MRLLFAILSVVLVASCVTPDDDRFYVGQAARSLVIIGVAEGSDNTSARYTMLWRQLDAGGEFTELDDDRAFSPETNTRGSIRVRGIPGEFYVYEIDPGTYALDGVYGIIRDRSVNYAADGIIEGPDRPVFNVRPGEAVYLGIWEANIVEMRAVARPYRLEQSDLRAVLASEDLVVGEVRPRATETRSVPCAPRRISTITQRRVC
jgi:hypothetical protein